MPAPALIKLKIETNGLVPADEIGDLLRATSDAFAEYLEARPDFTQPAQLVIVRLATGSVLIDLAPALFRQGYEAIEAFDALYSSSGILAGFATHISAVISKITAGMEALSAHQSATRLIEKSATIVDRGHATSVNFHINVSDGGSVHFNTELARSLLRQWGDASPKKSKPSSAEPPSPAENGKRDWSPERWERNRQDKEWLRENLRLPDAEFYEDGHRKRYPFDIKRIPSENGGDNIWRASAPLTGGGSFDFPVLHNLPILSDAATFARIWAVPLFDPDGHLLGVSALGERRDS